MEAFQSNSPEQMLAIFELLRLFIRSLSSRYWHWRTSNYRLLMFKPKDSLVDAALNEILSRGAPILGTFSELTGMITGD